MIEIGLKPTISQANKFSSQNGTKGGLAPKIAVIRGHFCRALDVGSAQRTSLTCDTEHRLKSTLALIISLTMVFSAPRSARAEDPVFSEASQRLMAVLLSDGLSVSESMPVYPVGQKWYLPLTELSNAIGLAIEATPSIGRAQGFVIEESRKFSISTTECRAEHDGQIDTFACNEAILYEDDIYVTAELIARILPLKIEVNTFRSEVLVHPKQKLPIQLRRERERGGGTGRRIGPYDPGYPRVEASREIADGLLVDQQLGYVDEKSGTYRNREFRHDSILTGELFGMESSAFISGTDKSVQRQRYTMARRDPEGGMLGPLNARDIQLIDVTFPTLPLVGGAGIFRGALISSYPINSPTQFGTRDFIGDLPSGWEVELYQNDVLIDRRLSNGVSYEFKAVPLLYGLNRFRLAFYGPQGQRREQFETYTIESSLLANGKSNYRLAFGGDEAVGENRWLMQYDKSVHPNVTIVSGLARTPDDKKLPSTYGLLGVRTYGRNVLFSSTVATKSDTGGFAWENGIQGPIGTATGGFSHTMLADFTSEQFQIERGHVPRDILKGNVAFNLFSQPTVRLTFEGAETYYADGANNFVLTQRTSTKTGPLHWFNALQYDEFGTGMTGELSTLAIALATEWRTIFKYDMKQVTSGSLEAQKRLSEKVSVTGGVQEAWVESIRRFYGSLNREFQSFTLSANASVDNRENFAIGALLSYSFGREPKNGSWFARPRSQALAGAASVFVYLDANQNGRFDLGEAPLKDVEITVDQQDSGALTDDRGVALVSGLKAYQATDVSIALRTLEDPFFRPNPKGLRFIPRPGKIVELEMPVIVSSELTGFVNIKGVKGNKPKRGLVLELRNAEGRLVKQVRTEADGYYLVEDLRLGTYTLQLDAKQLKANQLRSEPSQYTVVVGPQGLEDNVLDFTLIPPGYVEPTKPAPEPAVPAAPEASLSVPAPAATPEPQPTPAEAPVATPTPVPTPASAAP